MFTKNFYLGLDVSDLSVKVVQFKIAGDNLEIVSYGSAELPIGLIQNGEINKQDELITIIKDLFVKIKGEKIKSKYVGCSLPEEKSFVRMVSLPLMSDTELEEAIKWAAETEIPLRIDELNIGWQIIERHKGEKPGSDGHVDVLLVASPKNIVDSYIDLLEKIELTPILMRIESSLVVKSLINSANQNQDRRIRFINEKRNIIPSSFFTKKTNGQKNNKLQGKTIIKPTYNGQNSVLIVDIGAHRTNFIIFNGKTLYFTSTVEFGSNSLDEALSKTFKIDKKQAEKMKKDFGLDREEREGEIFDSLIPSLTGLAEEISKVLDYYKGHRAHETEQLDITKIVICGGGALLKGLSSHLKTSLGLDVETGNPWINFSSIDLTKKNKLPIIPKEISLAYTTALGICLSIKDEYNKL